MAATSAGHLQPQQQHQPTQQQQQKMNANCTINNNNMNRSSQQQQAQLHNMQQQQQQHQQQQHMMQQYALKQQHQHNYNMQHMHQQQQQQIMQQQHMQQQQMHLKMQQHQQQQQQMYQNSQESTMTHMMPCQNYMTPMPQTHNKFMANTYTSNTQHYQQQFNNHHRAMPTQIESHQHHNANLAADLLNGNSNYNNKNNFRTTTTTTSPTCIPPNVVAPSSTNQNIYPNQNQNGVNMKQQHSNSNSTNNNLINQQEQQQQQHYNRQQQQQQQQLLMQQNQKQQQQPQNNSHNNNTTNNTRNELNAKQHIANHNNDNTNNCNGNYNNTNLNDNFVETITNELQMNGFNNDSNNSISNHHSMLSGVKANIPPGWRRLTNNNNEIVYISPTGSTLRSPFQIKDYLLSPGTCKCGLPCPLQPEYFFDFNVQVPNTPLTMPTYQSNDFNGSTFNSSLTEAAATATDSMTTLAPTSLSSMPLNASCSTQQSALMTSTAPSDAFVVPPMETSTSSTSSSSSSSSSSLSQSSLSSSTSLSSSSSSLYSTSASIPSATSPSSLTCLHLKRFLDCQQLHAHPMESFTIDAKRRKIVSTESTFETTSSSVTLSPAATTQTTAASPAITSDSKLIFSSDDGNGGDTDGQQQQQETSHNSSFKLLPPPLQQQQQPHSQQHEQHLSNHQFEQQQQYMPTNTTYMVESANKTWPKDERIMPTVATTLAPQNESHVTPSTQQHITMNGGSETTHVQWSSNLCMKPQGICQTKQEQQQQQQQRTMAPADTNTKEEYQQQLDDLNGYLQHQTTIVHNSMMSLEARIQEQNFSEDIAIENEEEADEEEPGEDVEEEDEEEVEGEDFEEELADDEEEIIEIKHSKEGGEILKATNCLTDFMTNQEEIVDDFNEGEGANEDEEEDMAEEDPSDALEEEHEEEAEEEVTEDAEDNDSESINAVSNKPSTIDNNANINLRNKINFYQMPHSQNQSIKEQQQQFTNIQQILSPSPPAHLNNNLSFNTTNTNIKNPIQNIYRQQQVTATVQQQQSLRTPLKLVPTAQESPVSSSTVGGPRSTPDLQRKTPDNTKKPEQVGAISTSNESPKPCPPSPAGSIESTSSKASNSKPAPSPIPSPITMLHLKPQQSGSTVQKPPAHQVRILRHIKNAGHIPQQPHRLVATNTSRATVTTIAGNRGAATTTTTTSASAQRINASAPPPSLNQKVQATMQKVTANNATTSIPISQLQLQPFLRSNDSAGNSQIIMTSTGQLIVMPSTNNKPHIQQQQQQQQHQQLIIASGNATTTTQSQATTNVIIQQQGTQQMDVLNNAQQLTTATLQQQSNGSYIVSQPTNAQSTAAQLQPATVILNSGQNLITNNGTKVLTNTGNIIHTATAQPIITATNQLLTTPTNTGQQTVVLNALPNGGYVIQQQPQAAQATASQTQQQQYATLDGQVVQHLVQQADGRIIITSSADPKRPRPKKRKTSPSPAVSSGTTITTQISPTIQNQTATLLQQHVASLHAATQPAQTQPQVVQLTTAPAGNAATTATYPQQFQIGNGIQGIVVNKPAATTTTAQPQQILLQNGQIIQPMNLIGQQLILPTGLVMAPDTTLLQIQNVGSCGPTTNILTTTPQGTMMLRATSPQTNKQFIQSTTTGQQFIVGSNGQLSPIGQIYSTPMGLVMPANTQHNPTATATFVQQNATTIQVQPSHHHHQQQVTTTPQHHITLQALQQHPQSLAQQQQHVVNNQVGIVLETAATSTTSPNGHLMSSRAAAASPPDTTTHSPRSPERPPSHRSGGSDMVQCVSSSEPDGGTISPLSSDSRQSPSTTVCEKGIVMSTAYQNTNIYKPTEAKIRRVQTPPQYQVIGTAVGSVSNVGSGTITTNANHMTGLTNLTLQQHNPQQHQHHTTDNNGGNSKSDTHDSPQNSPTTTLMITTPPPSRTPTPQQHQQHQQQQHHQQKQQQQQQQLLQNLATDNREFQQSRQQQLPQQLKTPPTRVLGNGRNRNRALKTSTRIVKSLDAVENTSTLPSSSSSPPLAASLQRTFSVGELIWGPARGFPAWPGKVVKILDNQSESSVWVQWFGGGGRSNTEIMAIHLLQSLSEGLEAHHKAQKDTRKSRKLNSQLEKAIQEAMTELDRISATSTTATASGHKQLQQPTSSTQHQSSPPNRANKRLIPRTGGYEILAGLNNTSSNVISTTTGLAQSRHKPIRIAPAPPGGASNSPTKSSVSTASSTSSSSLSSSSSSSSPSLASSSSATAK